MTCIDAAIIKALVEHIGMNPDDVPDDGGEQVQESIPPEDNLSNYDMQSEEVINKLYGVVLTASDGSTFKWHEVDGKNCLSWQWADIKYKPGHMLLFQKKDGTKELYIFSPTSCMERDSR